MIPYPSWGTAVPRSRFVPLSGFVPRSGPDPDLMNNVRTWTSNFTHSLKGDAITHQCLNFNGGLLKPLLNYGYGCIIISHCFTFMKLLIHVVTQSHDHGHELLPFWMTPSGPVFCLLLGVSSDCAQPITGQVTEVTCPVIGRAQPELIPSKRQKTGPGLAHRCQTISQESR